MTPQRRKSRCSKLVVDGDVIWDPESLLKIWVDHFQRLTKSRLDDTAEGFDSKKRSRC